MREALLDELCTLFSYDHKSITNFYLRICLQFIVLFKTVIKNDSTFGTIWQRIYERQVDISKQTPVL